MKTLFIIVGALVGISVFIGLVGAWQGDRARTEHARIAFQNHTRRLEWQKAHPKEYALQKAQQRAETLRIEKRRIAAARATAEKQLVATRRQHAAAAARAAEESAMFHGTPDCLVLDKRSLTTESGDYTWYIEGKVKNTCDHDLSYAQVEFNFYDAAGNQESSGLVNINNLGAGETWAFKKPVYETQDGGGKWRVAGLSGF